MREPIERRQQQNGGAELPAVRVGVRAYNIARELGQIDLDNLQREVQEVGGFAIWWGVLWAQTQTVVARAKLRLEVVEGQTAKQLRVDKTRVGEKITDQIINEETKMHADVIRAKEALIEAEEGANILKTVAFAIIEKQKTLTKLTGALAREMDGDEDPLRTLQRGRTPDRRAVRA